MITVLTEECNISQQIYDSILSGLQLHQLVCPCCGHSGCMSVHGYYYRSVKYFPEYIHLHIMRVYCSECHSTHAILPSCIVPYSQIILEDQCKIIADSDNKDDIYDICNENPSIDESNVKYVIHSYLMHWKQKLLSQYIPLSPAIELVKRCFSEYSMQFMQNHRGLNILFRIPT